VTPGASPVVRISRASRRHERGEAAVGIPALLHELGEKQPRLGISWEEPHRVAQQLHRELDLTLEHVTGSDHRPTMRVAFGLDERLFAVRVGVGAASAAQYPRRLDEELRGVRIEPEQRDERLETFVVAVEQIEHPLLAERGDAIGWPLSAR